MFQHNIYFQYDSETIQLLEMQIDGKDEIIGQYATDSNLQYNNFLMVNIPK